MAKKLMSDQRFNGLLEAARQAIEMSSGELKRRVTGVHQIILKMEEGRVGNESATDTFY